MNLIVICALPLRFIKLLLCLDNLNGNPVFVLVFYNGASGILGGVAPISDVVLIQDEALSVNNTSPVRGLATTNYDTILTQTSCQIIDDIIEHSDIIKDNTMFNVADVEGSIGNGIAFVQWCHGEQRSIAHHGQINRLDRIQILIQHKVLLL